MRVSDETRQRFARLADTTGRPMTELLDEAVDALERRLFFDLLSARYAELRRDTGTWTEIETERDTESQVLGDRSA